MTFDHTKPFQTSNGLKARLLCADINGPDPLAVAITLMNSGVEVVCTYPLNGNGAPHLVNIPEKHKLHDILAAVAEGKEVEYEFRPGKWLVGNIFRDEADCLTWRVKP